MPRTAFFFLVGAYLFFRAPAPQWLCLRVAHLPGGSCWGWAFPQRARRSSSRSPARCSDSLLLRSAACFVKAFGITSLNRNAPPKPPPEAMSIDAPWARWAFSRHSASAPAFFRPWSMTRSPRSASVLIGATMPAQGHVPWSVIHPVAAARSSYDGFAIFLLLAAVTGLAIAGARRLATHAVRRAPAWIAASPIRALKRNTPPRASPSPSAGLRPDRVRRGERGAHAPPARRRPPASARRSATGSGIFYAPVAGFVDRLAASADRLQFLTIRRYLFFVFAGLVTLLLALALTQ